MSYQGRRLLAVDVDAALGVFGEEREIEALDRLAAFVGELGSDAAFVLEAGDFMASGAAIELHQGFALGLEAGIVHERRRIVLRVGMLQGDEIARDVAGILDAQAQAGHDRGLLHDELVAIVGASRMIEVEDERQIVLGVVFGTKIALFEGAIGARALARIVHPTHQVIVIILFADAAQIGGKRSTDHAGAFAHGMAGEATTRFEEILAMLRHCPWAAWAAPDWRSPTAR